MPKQHLSQESLARASQYRSRTHLDCDIVLRSAVAWSVLLSRGTRTLLAMREQATSIRQAGSSLMDSPSNHPRALAKRIATFGMLSAVLFTTLGGNESEARAINKCGDVAGSSNLCIGFSPDNAFLYHNGDMKNLGTLGGSCSYAGSMNDF